MSSNQLQTARQLIETGRYQEAKRLLEQIDHPTARQWLEKINQRNTVNETAPISFPEAKRIETIPRPTQAQEIIVTTTDLPYPYKVIAPIYFQTSNKGVFSSNLGKLKKKYADEIAEMRKQGAMSKSQIDFGFLWYGENSIGQNDFEAAFYVAVREIQNRAWSMKAHAVVGMRQDIDLDTSVGNSFICKCTVQQCVTYKK